MNFKFTSRKRMIWLVFLLRFEEEIPNEQISSLQGFIILADIRKLLTR